MNTTKTYRQIMLPLALAAFAWLTAAAKVGAADTFASDWSTALKSKARLIVAGAGPNAWHAGVEVALSPRTVTYWRMPGEAGSPPGLSTAGSENLSAADLRFPAPRRLEEDGIEAFGYLERVVFPLTLTAADPSKPVRLRLRFDYAACERICIPVHADWDMVLPSGAGAGPFAGEIAAAEARVPVKVALGNKDALRIDTVHPVTGGLADGKGRFVVAAHIPRGEASASLFAEAPPGWYLQPSRATPQADGSVTFDVAVLQAPSGARPDNTALTLTLTAGARSIEVPATLDSKGGAS